MLSIDREHITNIDEKTFKKTAAYYANYCCITAARRDFLPN
ncbi:Uncharacterised protein [Yersinia enterocolitica]|nr:Uncharacterised protein [Yersinia enterocolitica]CNF04365.1 Uncharacterised protein [Yersinia enterocolitica]